MFGGERAMSTFLTKITPIMKHGGVNIIISVKGTGTEPYMKPCVMTLSNRVIPSVKALKINHGSVRSLQSLDLILIIITKNLWRNFILVFPVTAQNLKELKKENVRSGSKSLLQCVPEETPDFCNCKKGFCITS